MKVDNNNVEFYLVNNLKSIVKEFWKKKEYENLSLQIQKLIPFGWDDIKKKGKQKPKPRYSAFGYDIRLPDKALAEYKIFYKLQELLWKSKLQEYRINPDKFLKDLKLEAKSRLIIGLGDESVYETSIRLHRNYGVPYIPGSALKGVTKHWSTYMLTEILQEFRNNDDFFKLAKSVQQNINDGNSDFFTDKPIVVNNLSDDARKFAEIFGNLNSVTPQNIAESLIKIFGTQSYEGSIIFFDAFPIPNDLNGKPILELDIMNPHYQPYYQYGEPPGDWHQPNPIFFLTVPEGVTFQFAIAPRNNEGTKLLNRAKLILISALKDFGVGAKTSLGYGRFH